MAKHFRDFKFPKKLFAYSFLIYMHLMLLYNKSILLKETFQVLIGKLIALLLLIHLPRKNVKNS